MPNQAEIAKRLITTIEESGSIRLDRFAVELNPDDPTVDVKYCINADKLEQQILSAITEATEELRAEHKLKIEDVRREAARWATAYGDLVAQNKSQLAAKDAEIERFRLENESLKYAGTVFILFKEPNRIWQVKRPKKDHELEMLEDIRRMHPDADVQMMRYRAGDMPDLWVDDADEYIAMMHAEDTPDRCAWKLIDADADHWSGECGAEWVFETCGPIENEMKFCPGCGRAVVIKDKTYTGGA